MLLYVLTHLLPYHQVKICLLTKSEISSTIYTITKATIIRLETFTATINEAMASQLL